MQACVDIDELFFCCCVLTLFLFLKGAASVVETASLFTGTGFACLSKAGDRVVWLVTVPPRTINYTIIIRYQVCILFVYLHVEKVTFMKLYVLGHY